MLLQDKYKYLKCKKIFLYICNMKRLITMLLLSLSMILVVNVGFSSPSENSDFKYEIKKDVSVSIAVENENYLVYHLDVDRQIKKSDSIVFKKVIEKVDKPYKNTHLLVDRRKSVNHGLYNKHNLSHKRNC